MKLQEYVDLCNSYGLEVSVESVPFKQSMEMAQKFSSPYDENMEINTIVLDGDHVRLFRENEWRDKSRHIQEAFDHGKLILVSRIYNLEYEPEIESKLSFIEVEIDLNKPV